MRRCASVWAEGKAAAKSSSRVPKVLHGPKAPVAPTERKGEGGVAPGAVYDLGTSEGDGPVTWEALVSSRETPAIRGAGDQSPYTERAGGRRSPPWPSRVAGGSANNEPSVSWQVEARGTGAEADGDEGVGGPRTSEEAG
jgi:hypothetical protein